MKLLPPFDEDDERAPALAVAHWRDAITPADALLFATPEYNSSIPGQLKNAVDWASRPVNDARLKDKDAVLELDGILIELLYSALQRRVA